MELASESLGIGARVKHPTFGEGIVVEMAVATLTVFFRTEGDKEISRSFEGLKVLKGAAQATDTLDLKTVENSIRKVLKEYNALPRPVDLASKWKGGVLELIPADRSLQSKELPIETFFHKIVMVRDRLRVLEQNVNSSDKLDDQDKVQLQQYISRIYGSLTTFNILFADKEDHFSSK